MTASISPPTSVVTAWKAYASAVARPGPALPSADQDRGTDRFGPAVSAPGLSPSMQAAMEEAAKSADTPSGYDRTGKPT